MITDTDLYRAAHTLSLTPRGRNCIRAILEWLDGDAHLGLDAAQQQAVAKLLTGAWGRYAMTARDAMREAIEVTI